ncbi:hypothetical protein GCM10027515_15010 [Schumannella luteola]|uniref:Uncharacterized protein n=1 Tax=Schumannella luteola TaxID=472059 RepID=A0A852Y4U4_9MICO|nr:hypothetical protein [Schumannella luteola]NYG97946.1 hypothetical protein [Schumannella luteola]TPX03080.1 hypothetical protein FJ656_19285 [Schumannella luteola]
MADDGKRVAFDRDQYKKVQKLVTDVETSSADALYGTDGYGIDSDLRAQPTEARWEVAVKVGNDVAALAGQVRTFTDTFTDKTLPDFNDQLETAEKLFDETDDLSTAKASGTGTA